MTDTGKGPRLDRRGFMGASALGGAALVGGIAAPAAALAAENNPATGAPQVDFPAEPRAFGGSGTSRTEMELRDCEVEGNWPKDLDGAFYRVGPDPQYPKPEQYKNDIVFDGEGDKVSPIRLAATRDPNIELIGRILLEAALAARQPAADDRQIAIKI